MNKDLIDLRHQLHKNPELSDYEKETSSTIINFIQKHTNPTQVITNIGGFGIVFIYDSKEGGPTILFRSELDALPIEEINEFDYKSSKNTVSHKCGHDGHMSILSGLALKINEHPPQKGKIVLLFQPAEETGQGAARMLKDEKFNIQPDHVFALHNLPGFPLGSMIIRDDVFSSASSGLIIKLQGKTSHAGEPERGNNPAFAMGEILKGVEKYSKPEHEEKGIKLITPIYNRLGEKAFGTTPGYAEMMFTIRATYTQDFEDLKNETLELIKNTAGKHNLKLDISWTEEFPNTTNDEKCNKLLRDVADKLNIETITPEVPFRWSEDFGHFTHAFKGALFGLGSGENQPALHNPDYDFPDKLIETGSAIFYAVVEQLLK